MGDDRLRELERRWRETGSVHDEVPYLRERVRCGDLEQEMLELAAYLGHEPARQLTHVSRLRLADPRGGSLELPGGPEAWVRLAIAAARTAQGDGWAPVALLQPELALDAAEAWAVQPQADPSHAWREGMSWQWSGGDAEGQWVRAEQELLDLVWFELGGEDWHPAWEAVVSHAARAIDLWFQEGWELDEEWIALRSALCGVWAGEAALAAAGRSSRRDPPTPYPAELAQLATSRLGTWCLWEAAAISAPSELKRALKEELVPWALGQADPVAERVKARGA